MEKVYNYKMVCDRIIRILKKRRWNVFLRMFAFLEIIECFSVGSHYWSAGLGETMNENTFYLFS